MLKRNFMWCSTLTIVAPLLFIQSSAFGYEITDKFSIGGVLAGAYQYQSGDDIDGFIPGIRATVEF